MEVHADAKQNHHKLKGITEGMEANLNYLAKKMCECKKRKKEECHEEALCSNEDSEQSEHEHC